MTIQSDIRGARREDDRVRGGVLRYAREAAMTASPLPGEVELARRLDATRQQVRNALAALENQGIVKRRQGAATTVDLVALRMNVRLEEQLEHSELLERLGYEAAVEVLDVRRVPAGDGAAALLTETGGEPVRIVKRWSADGRPAMVAEDTVAVPDGWDGDIGSAGSVFALVERVWGEPIVWEVATPGVIVLDEQRAEQMGLPVGAPALTFDILGMTVGGRRAFHAIEVHNPDIVSYSLLRTVRPPWSSTSGI
ncbi:GntR family transcriptional regulator [Herbiconiux sp. L3-i23]|uniref:GntR family transcriptional regulator n=1 Tax=Herbiconiux sp. L3-i23 TaxID=2905871 RepID=UPI00204CB5CA|nr:GntR family transcriptional regulator [Herbiconiux sp. L3-i23]BDI23515.1 GntR family transcriptional regulator [Herbiconiux sp. L3-i23]